MRNSNLFDDPWSCRARAEKLNLESCQSLARNIRELRKKVGMSQQELARRLRTTQSDISRFESDKNTKMSILTLSKMADAFEGQLLVSLVLTTESDEPLLTGFGTTKNFWVQKQIEPNGKRSYCVMRVNGGPIGESYKCRDLATERCFELEGQCVMCLSRLKPRQGYLCYTHCYERWLECGKGSDCL